MSSRAAGRRQRGGGGGGGAASSGSGGSSGSGTSEPTEFVLRLFPSEADLGPDQYTHLYSRATPLPVMDGGGVGVGGAAGLGGVVDGAVAAAAAAAAAATAAAAPGGDDSDADLDAITRSVGAPADDHLTPATREAAAAAQKAEAAERASLNGRTPWLAHEDRNFPGGTSEPGLHARDALHSLWPDIVHGDGTPSDEVPDADSASGATRTLDKRASAVSASSGGALGAMALFGGGGSAAAMMAGSGAGAGPGGEASGPDLAYEVRDRDGPEAHPVYDALLAATGDAHEVVNGRLVKVALQEGDPRPESYKMYVKVTGIGRRRAKGKKDAAGAGGAKGGKGGKPPAGPMTAKERAEAAAAAKAEALAADAAAALERLAKAAAADAAGEGGAAASDNGEAPTKDPDAPASAEEVLKAAQGDDVERGVVHAASLAPSAVQDMLRLARAGYEEPGVPGDPPPNWNDKFQCLLEAPMVDNVSIDKRYTALDALWHEFVGAVTPDVRKIVENLSKPRSRRPIRPVQVPFRDAENPTRKELLQRERDSSMYLHRGVMFHIVDDASHAHGSGAYAAKAAAHELKATRWLASCDLPSVHFPLVAIVDYLGYRLVATALLPLPREEKDLRMWYGSLGKGMDVMAPTEDSDRVAGELAALMNVAAHPIAFPAGSPRARAHARGTDREAPKPPVVVLPADAQGIVGADGRRYLANVRRLFPPSARVGVGTALAQLIPRRDEQPIQLVPMPQVPDHTTPKDTEPPPHLERAAWAVLGAPDEVGACCLTKSGQLMFYRGGAPEHEENHNSRASVLCGRGVTGNALLLPSYTRPQAHLWQRLRPELVRNHHVPLSSDAFTALGRMGHKARNGAVVAATERLVHDELPALCHELEMNVRVMERPESWTGTTSYVNALFHRRGVNLRHMGRVRALSSSPRLRELLLAELLARTLAWLINRSLQGLQGKNNFHAVIVAHLNNAMGYLVADDVDDDDDDGAVRRASGDDGPESPVAAAAAKASHGPGASASATGTAQATAGVRPATSGSGSAAGAGFGSMMANLVQTAARQTEMSHQNHLKQAVWLRFEHALSPAELQPNFNLWTALADPSRLRCFRRVQILTGVRLGSHVDGRSPLVYTDVFDAVDCHVKDVGPLTLPDTWPRMYWRGEGGERCLVQTRFERRNFMTDEAIARYERELRFREMAIGQLSPHLISLLNLLGDLFCRQDKTFKRAEHVLKRTITVWQVAEKEEADPIACVLALVRLAEYYRQGGNLRDAERTYLDAIDMERKELGVDTVDATSTMNDLASLYVSAGLFESAEGIYAEVKAQLAAHYGTESTRYATVCSNMATLYMRTGDYKKAELELLCARDIERSVLGPRDLDYIATVFSLSRLYTVMGRLPEAEALGEMTRDLQSRAIGEEQPDSATTLCHLAQIAQAQGKFKDAEALLMEAREIQLETVTKESQAYAETLYRMALLWEEMKQFSDAEHALNEAAVCLRKCVGEDHPLFARMLHMTSKLFEQMGAESLLRREAERQELNDTIAAKEEKLKQHLRSI